MWRVKLMPLKQTEKARRKAGTDTPFKLPKGESVPVFRRAGEPVGLPGYSSLSASSLNASKVVRNASAPESSASIMASNRFGRLPAA